MYLLAGQMVDKFQSKEGAQEALSDIDRLLESKPTLSYSTDTLTPETQVGTHAHLSDTHTHTYMTDINLFIYQLID